VNFHITPCRLTHIFRLSHNLRPEERAELALVTDQPRHIMVKLYSESVDPYAALLYGRPVAAWGDCAPVLSSEGHLWLFTAPEVENIPLTFFACAKAEVERYLLARQALRFDILASSERSARFWRMLGFSIGEEAGGFRECRRERAWAEKD
jgi:hypothetical protein